MSWKTLLAALLCAAISPLSATPIPVFINELHYDNIGADTGEAIELAGPAGFDLSGWTLFLYNGSNGLSYREVSLSGTFNDHDDGYGVLDFNLTGIQNGNPDGIALVSANDQLIQFLSYEGSFFAKDRLDSWPKSTDISLAESSSTPVGNSLALVGTGRNYSDFSWQAGTASFGQINAGQDFMALNLNNQGSGSVPLPASVALVIPALPLLGLARRRLISAPA